jgi:copper chaperone NosL
MTLADPRFAAELVTRTGKTFPFDDIGCMATYIATGGVDPSDIHSLWVHDVTRADSLLPLSAVLLLTQDSIATPMDHGIVAVRPGPAADSLRVRVGGRILSWDEVLTRVAASTR